MALEDPNSSLPTIPRPLAEALRRGQSGVPDLSGMDEVVLTAARGRLRRRSPLGLVLRAGSGLAAAAAIAMAVYFVWTSRTGPSPVLADAPGPGAKVTILDAFRLARLLEQGGGAGGGIGGSVDAGRWGAWDVTGDGVVDRKDVEALAQRAVRLSAAGGAGARKGGGA